MSWHKVNYPIIHIKGMNSTLIDEYILHTVKSINWTNDILTNINSKSDFSNLLTSTFGDNLITSNVNDSSFNTSLYGPGFIYGTISSNGASATDFVLLLTTASGPLFSAKISKPKSISCKLRWYNIPNQSASPINGALCLFGILLDNDVILLQADGSNGTTSSNLIYGGTYIDNGNNKILNLQEGWNNVSVNINVDTDLPNCFKENKNEYELKLVTPTYNNTYGYVYLESLVIS